MSREIISDSAKSPTISIIGTGNVAQHLGSLFVKAGLPLLDIYGRSSKKSKDLAQQLHCDWVTSIEELKGDLILLCVKDEVVASILSELPLETKVIYTSGSVQLDSLGRSGHTGVLYPLQTFSSGEELLYPEIPILIEAQDEELLTIIESIAKRISNHVYQVNSKDRIIYHLAAIWLNNFTNHLIYQSKQIIDAHGLDYHLLTPILMETAEKMKTQDPFLAQTGPAKRNDQRIIQLHESMLEGVQKDIYHIISKSITNTYASND